MGIKKLLHFLNRLEKHKIYYKLEKVRNEAIMVEAVLPGQRWEIEFMDDGTVEIEKFISDDGDIYDEQEIETLFREFGD